MRVLVTGATGFVGRHVVAALVARGHSVVAASRTRRTAASMPWFGQVSYVECDVQRDFARLLEAQPPPDVLLHLAWPGLPNYRDFFHLHENLPADLRFLSAAVSRGVPRLMVAGTCLEYGMQFGPLEENGDTRPTTAYGLAKDTLRKSLQLLQGSLPFTLQWVRLFYMYGEGQNPKSLLATLDRAIDEGLPAFNMSAGDQLRDYLPIEAVAGHFARLVEHPECSGVINCCSGRPVSVRQMVEQRCEARGASLRLNRGYYPYPDYEPLAFWGVPSKLAALGEAAADGEEATRTTRT